MEKLFSRIRDLVIHRSRQSWKELKPSEEDTLATWRELIFIAVFSVTLLLGGISLVQNMKILLQTGDFFIAAILIVFYLIAVVIVIKRTIPFTVRVWLGVLMYYVTGLLSLILIGPVGSGRSFLIAVCVLVTLMLGLRQGLIALGINGLSMIFVGMLMSAGMLEWANVADYTIQIWTVNIGSLIFLSAVITVSTGVLVKQLELKISYEQMLVEQMESAGAKLEQEIFERRQTEKALRESEERLGMALQGAQLGLWDWDIKSGRLTVNRRFTEMIGYSQSEFEPHISALEAAIHPDDVSRVRDIWNEHLLGNAPYFVTEYRLRTKSGEWRSVLSSGRVVKEDPSSERAVGISMDISGRKQMEKAMLEAQKLAALGTLAAGVAHEINSPLQVITGLSERYLRQLKKDSADDDSKVADFEMINRNAWRIADIVRSLLTFARASPDSSEQNNLNEIIIDTLLLIEHKLKSWANVNIEYDLDQDIPDMLCNRNSITQVLINLLTNAADAMPEGGTIDIRTRLDRAARIIELKVKDSGMGIPDEVLSRIFDPFFTTKPVGKGTGLGLSIVMGIIQAHNGELAVESDQGKGTTFIIHFPESSINTLDSERGKNSNGDFAAA